MSESSVGNRGSEMGVGMWRGRGWGPHTSREVKKQVNMEAGTKFPCVEIHPVSILGLSERERRDGWLGFGSMLS